MPSTEPNITCPVDERFHRNRGKCGFRCVAHETIEIAVRIEIRVSVLVWNHAVKRLFGLVHLKASREYHCEFKEQAAGGQHGSLCAVCAPYHMCAAWCQHVHSKCQQECAESMSMNNERPVTAASLFLNLAVRHSKYENHAIPRVSHPLLHSCSNNVSINCIHCRQCPQASALSPVSHLNASLTAWTHENI